ncbi:MAG: phage tail protein, partial [Helicobacteraceae bacterium]|nr:phage tail protein [Helicobacteraceae bacterium]
MSAIETLLPSNESAELKALDNALGKRINACYREISNLPSKVEAKYLPILAASFDTDISHLTEEDARALLTEAIWLKAKAGTIGALRGAAKSYGGLEIDDQIGGYLFDATLTIDRDLSAEKLEYLRAYLDKHKNARSRLRNLTIALPSAQAQMVVFAGMQTSLDCESTTAID